MAEHVAVKAHAAQDQKRADNATGKRQRHTRHQSAAHESERRKGFDEERVHRHHAPIAGNTASVGPQATHLRASTRVKGKRARTSSRSCRTAMTVRPS